MPGCLTTTARVRQRCSPCRSLIANHNLETTTKQEVSWEGLTTQFSEASSSSPEGTAAYSRRSHFCRMRNAGFPVSMKTINLIQIFWIIFYQIHFFSLTAQWWWSKFRQQLDTSCQIVHSYVHIYFHPLSLGITLSSLLSLLKWQFADLLH